MDTHPIHIPQRDTLADLYIHHFERTASLYSYAPYKQDSYEKRLDEVAVMRGRVERSALTGALRAYNERVNQHPAVQSNIDLLDRADSVAVIGGQQAGIMTGPLYTVHKAISILQLARQQCEILQVPVVPVFWIAGEDHDLDEVNHIWVERDPSISRAKCLERVRFEVRDKRKVSVGQRKLVMEDVEVFLKKAADSHPDSPFKNVWMEKLRELAQQSQTLSDWFAHIFHWLFAHEGLVLFDSAAQEFKQIVAPFYAQLIEKAEAINEAVVEGSNRVEQIGFRPQVGVLAGQANLFIEENGERALLFKQGETFLTKDGKTAYSRKELTDIAYTHPERLSTNVVTRPLLQDYLFPTLSAVLGPGEIAYWGQYGQAFSLFGWNMPVLFPRVGFTLVEQDVRRTMEAFGLSADDAMFRLDAFREKWLNQQDDIGVEALFSELANDVAELHATRTRPVLSLNRGIAELVEKNRERILRELSYLENQVHRTIRLKYDSTLKQFDRVQRSFTPQGKPQERVYNVFSYVNQYGLDWLNTLVREPLDLTQSHYLVYL